MGMFDDIVYQAPCPICGLPMERWQSKDGGCGLQKLTPRQLWGQKRTEQTEIKFYDNCGKCGTWVEIRVADGIVDWNDDDYRRFAETRRMPPHKRGPVLT